MNNKHIFWIIVVCVCIGVVGGLVLADPIKDLEDKLIKDKPVKDKVVKNTYVSVDKKLVIEMEKDTKALSIKDINMIINQEKDKNKGKDIKSFSIVR